PPGSEAPTSGSVAGEASAVDGEAQRYRPLPTGTHGLDPQLVKRDQRERLEQAMIELIAAKGYPRVRIVDLAKLAHVSQPTFYSLYADKESLFLSAYEAIATRSATVVLEAYGTDGPHEQRVVAAMRAWAELAAAEPEATSLLVLGAFGAGARALERRTLIIEELERAIHLSRDGAPGADPSDLTVKAIIGGVREVTAARLREGRADELPALVDELTAWAACYPRRLPAGLQAPPVTRRRPGAGVTAAPSARARRAEGRLPSGRSDMPRQFIVKSQRERIVDATAAIVAEKGLAGLKVPDIARRANVSLQTFYSIYASKHEAFLGAQKVGMHQALGVAVAAYQAQGEDWPRAVSAGLRALIDFLTSEPVHAHLSLVDTFAACPEALEIRNSTLLAFGAYFGPGYELARDRVEVPPIAGEAIAGGIWQVLHHYIENDCIAELPGAAPQLIYFALTPFVGVDDAAELAREARAGPPAPAAAMSV
ncbi:MAG TPA: TetR/AcrR family transcriptional regulator, partial [Solirubrobacteraceae bacterium]|nr:TetR/AcrR family transcriptional regulator [Solirubrobacteraceae bacterium]